MQLIKSFININNIYKMTYKEYSIKYIEKTLHKKELKEIKTLEVYKRIPYGLGKSKMNKEELINLIKEYVKLCKRIEDFEKKIIKEKIDTSKMDLKVIENFCKIKIKNPVKKKEIKKSIFRRLLDKIKIKNKK
jgi:hypothetical protein